MALQALHSQFFAGEAAAPVVTVAGYAGWQSAVTSVCTLLFLLLF